MMNIDPDKIQALTDTVVEHCTQHERLDNTQFDAMLIAYEIIQSVPSLSNKWRGAFTRLRDDCRRHVGICLRDRGKVLRQIKRNQPPNGAVYILEDVTINSLVTIQDAPEKSKNKLLSICKQFERAMQNAYSEVAKEIPPTLAEQFMTNIKLVLHQSTNLQRTVIDSMMTPIHIQLPADSRDRLRPLPVPPRKLNRG